MRPLASDFTPDGSSLSVDWMRMTPYAATGTFLSRVFDAGSPSAWGNLSWTSQGATVALSVRTGNTPTPDGTWTTTAIAASGDPISATSRYLQYQAVLTTSDTSTTPALQDVTIGFTAGQPGNSAPVANNDSYTTNEDTALVVPAPGVIGNDTDADGDPLTATLVGVVPTDGTFAPAVGRIVHLHTGFELQRHRQLYLHGDR